MNILKKVTGNRQYIASTGKLGVWIPLMEPTARAGEFHPPQSGWEWTGAEIYVLASGKIVHVQGDWTAIEGRKDRQAVTVFASGPAALEACGQMEYPAGPAYLADLLRKAGLIESLPTLD